MGESFGDRIVENVVMVDESLMSRFWFSKIGRERFSRAARLLAGTDQIEAQTNQRVVLGQSCCATLPQHPYLWLSKSRSGDTVLRFAKSLESW